MSATVLIVDRASDPLSLLLHEFTVCWVCDFLLMFGAVPSNGV